MNLSLGGLRESAGICLGKMYNEVIKADFPLREQNKSTKSDPYIIKGENIRLFDFRSLNGPLRSI